MKKQFLISISLICSVVAVAQKNVVKLHLESLPFKALNFGFERAIKDKVSVGFNLGYLTPREIPDFIYSPTQSESYVERAQLKNNISGTTFVPEIRLYPGLKGAPKFFYLGVYGKFNKYNLELSETFTYNFSDEEFNNLDQNADYYEYVNEQEKSIVATTELDFGLRQLGLGLQLGVQFPLGNRVSLDWGIAGLGFNAFNLKGEYKVIDVPVDYSRFAEEAEASFNADIKDIPFIGDAVANLENEGGSIKASLPFASAGFRTYLSLGVRF